MGKDICLDCFNCVLSKRKVKYGGEDYFEFFGSCILTGEEVLKGENSANKIVECNHFNQISYLTNSICRILYEISKDLLGVRNKLDLNTKQVVKEEIAIKEKPKEELIKNGNKPKAKK